MEPSREVEAEGAAAPEGSPVAVSSQAATNVDQPAAAIAPPAPEKTAVAAPEVGTAETAAAARRRNAAIARRDAEAARGRRHAVWLKRARTLLLVLGAGALTVWLARTQLLRSLARRDSDDDLRAWAIERLATAADAESFDIYVRELGRRDADHALFHRLVYQLGGREGVPAQEGGDLLPEVASAVTEHTRFVCVRNFLGEMDEFRKTLDIDRFGFHGRHRTTADRGRGNNIGKRWRKRRAWPYCSEGGMELVGVALR